MSAYESRDEQRLDWLATTIAQGPGWNATLLGIVLMEFRNAIRHRGALPLDALKAAIDQQLPSVEHSEIEGHSQGTSKWTWTTGSGTKARR